MCMLSKLAKRIGVDTNGHVRQDNRANEYSFQVRCYRFPSVFMAGYQRPSIFKQEILYFTMRKISLSCLAKNIFVSPRMHFCPKSLMKFFGKESWTYILTDGHIPVSQLSKGVINGLAASLKTTILFCMSY